MEYGIGIDLGGTSVKAVAVTPAGDALARDNHNFRADAVMDWATTIGDITRRMQATRGEEAKWLGLSAPGLTAASGHAIAHMPGRLHGLEGLDWTTYLQVKQPVPVLNDAHAALLGEAWLGAARGFSNVIMLTLGTGVGGAAMVDGRLLRGEIGRAGHLGHACLDPFGVPDICGTPGSLEMCIGNCTVEARSGGRYNTTHDLVRAHLAGESDATTVWMHSVRLLACAVVSFVNILDPAAVIIGGGIARAGAALFEPLQRFVDGMEWRPGGHRVRILHAELGEFAGAFGAAHHALRCR